MSGLGQSVRLVLVLSGALLQAVWLTSCSIGNFSSSTVVAVGELDADFNAQMGTGFRGAVDSMALDSAGNIYVAGRFTDFKSKGIANLVKLTSTGAISSDFSIGTGFNDTVYVVAVDTNDNVYVGGDFTSYKGVAVPRLAKLSSTGDLDLSFNLNLLGGPSATVSSIVFGSDGSIYVAGSFATFNGSTFARLVRLNSSGLLDANFNTGTGFNLGVDSMLLSGSSVVVGGSFTSYASSTAKRLAKVAVQSGSNQVALDSSFNAAIGTGFDATVRTLALDSANDLYVGGAFTNFRSLASTDHFVKIDSSGELDTTYLAKLPAGLNAEVTGLALQDNGDLIVAGNFTGGLYRIGSDGAEDADFTTARGTGTNDQINAVVIQSNGRILIGGEFSTFGGTSVGGLLRLK